MKRIAALLAMIFLLTSCTTNIEPTASPDVSEQPVTVTASESPSALSMLPSPNQPPVDSVTPHTAIEESPDPEPTDDASRPYSPFPSEIPYTEPKPKDADYIAPVSDMDFSAPGIYEVAENVTYSVDLDGDDELKPPHGDTRYPVIPRREKSYRPPSYTLYPPYLRHLCHASRR